MKGKIDPKKIEIRFATLDDLEEICNLSQELFEFEEPWEDNRYFMGWSHSQYGRKFFTKCLTNKKKLGVLAIYENSPFAYLVGGVYIQNWRADNPIGEIYNLYVKENFRGLGIGTKLIEKAKDRWRELKVNRLKVIASFGNKKALDFYRKYGFKNFNVILEKDIE